MDAGKYKVLFLEDEPTIRDVLTEYMVISGYEVTGTDRGDKAMELLDKNLLYVNLCDIDDEEFDIGDSDRAFFFFFYGEG